jgi:hypothetical protein
MQQNARRRRPLSIFLSRNQHTRSASARDPKTRPHGREDGQTDGILNDFLWNLLQHPLFTHDLVPVGWSVLFYVKSILCGDRSAMLTASLESKYILQKVLRILAALSLSLSRVVGQKASLPILFENLLIGAPSLSATTINQTALNDRFQWKTHTKPSPDFIESSLTSTLGLIPRRENGSDLLHSVW